MYKHLDDKTDTHHPTMVLAEEEHTVEVVGNDMKQMGMPKVDMLHLSNGKCGGQEGGAKNKTVPTTFVRCDEQSCQFSMELEDEVSAKRVLQNNNFVAHKRRRTNSRSCMGERGAGKGAPSTK